LIKANFNQAIQNFNDGSIDCLCIDLSAKVSSGITQDFLKKIREGGIIVVLNSNYYEVQALEGIPHITINIANGINIYTTDEKDVSEFLRGMFYPTSVAEAEKFFQIIGAYFSSKAENAGLAYKISKNTQSGLNNEAIFNAYELEIYNLKQNVDRLTVENEKIAKELKEKTRLLWLTNNHVKNLESKIEAMRIKNRLKKLIIKIVPAPVRRALKSLLPKPVKKWLKKKFRPTKKTIYVYKSKFNEKSILNEIDSFEIKPLISVIIPVYNVAPQWLDAAIESVKKQFYKNWEICIADDGSTNIETKKYLEKIVSDNIKVVFLEKNVNISAASNEALKLASGEYIALLDNDDELTCDALYEVVKAINNTGADIIYSDEDKLDSKGDYCDPRWICFYLKIIFAICW
jgi:glycosyltransferase involved in cell wall biosynthesis